ncbi:energy transducer TonB [Agrilutibacter solisilvae]|uniref:Energy transducer TonB n=1 Tax=Agrilutibacter solisilvae TaxID=2763317 RepID=A0A975AS66_9GAMM|nr:energy transducer TonB [Lysobacter solisilvae]QSX77754.1 energy transducer TonB [Lysobacter solisilvae]
MTRSLLPTCALAVAGLVLAACGKAPAPAASLPPATPPMAQHTPPPDYPPELACRQVGGQVVLDVRLAPNGVPVGIDIFRSSGVKALDDSAVTAVRGWQFKGATAGGKPVPSKVQVPVTFAPPNPPPDECNRYL